MTKRKVNTIQEKFGFMDFDLKKPGHDEIMKWTDNNLDSILKECFEHKVIWSISERFQNKINAIPALISNLKDTIEKKDNNLAISSWKKEILQELFSWKGFGQLPTRKSLKIDDNKWEYVIQSGKYVIGFVDLYVTFSIPSLNIRGIDDANSGYKLELNHIPRWEIHWNKRGIAFEIKTEINSLGELIRQIRLYQNYMPGIDFIVISPDDSHTELLKSQNIGFYKYEPNKFL